jgi:thioredoxin 1
MEPRQMNVRNAALLLVAAATLATGCSRGDAAVPAAPAPASSHAQGTPGSLPRLVFFMNPNGMPCQMQDRVLREMGVELTARADVVYYKTTEPADIARFQEYGIRSLPLLVVTDGSGRELRRATPGIHSMPEILQLLQP